MVLPLSGTGVCHQTGGTVHRLGPGNKWLSCLPAIGISWGNTMFPFGPVRCTGNPRLGVTPPASPAQGEGARDPAWGEVPSGGQGCLERASRYLLPPLPGSKGGRGTLRVPEGIGGRSGFPEAESQETVPARWQEGQSGRAEGPQAAAQTVMKPERWDLALRQMGMAWLAARHPKALQSPGCCGSPCSGPSLLVREGGLPSPRDPDTLKGPSVGVPDTPPRPVGSGVEKAQISPFSFWLACPACLSPDATWETRCPAPPSLC